MTRGHLGGVAMGIFSNFSDAVEMGEGASALEKQMSRLLRLTEFLNCRPRALVRNNKLAGITAVLQGSHVAGPGAPPTPNSHRHAFSS